MPKTKLARDLGVPTGAIESYSGDVLEIPAGWLYCNGQTVSRAEYAKLFEKIGTSFGQGDGSTTFHLPDLRGRFIRGRNAGSGRDPNSGARTASNAGGNTGDNIGSVQADAMQGHRHSQRVTSHDGVGINIGGARGIYSAGDTSNADFVLAPKTDGTNGTPRTTSESRPINIGLDYIIKT